MKITNAKLLNRKSLVGSFDLEMPSGLIVRGALLFEKDGRRWVNFPSKEWTKQDGTKGYFPLLEFASREIGDKFQKQVLPLAEEALLGAPETRRREVVPEPERPMHAPKQERQRAYPDDEIPF
jgi:hypothetical protein